jgi:hypothetical protein
MAGTAANAASTDSSRVNLAAEQLHYEDGPAVRTERTAGFFFERREQQAVLAGHLRAHRTGHDVEVRIGVQPLDEVLDRRHVVCIEGIEADFNCRAHLCVLVAVRGAVTSATAR